jgi:hypothetical protein
MQGNISPAKCDNSIAKQSQIRYSVIIKLHNQKGEAEMKKMKRKLLGIILTAVMLVCLLPQVTVKAEDLTCPSCKEGTLVANPAKSPTCDKYGNHAFFKCNKCGKCFFAMTGFPEIADASWVAIAPTGHTLVVTPAVAATCTTAGTSAGVTCSVCKTVFGAAQTIPAFGHQYVVTNIKTATSKADGSITETCSICGGQQVTTIKKASTIELSQTTMTYNGSARKPKVSVFDSDGNVVAKSEYTVSYSNNKKVGTAKVTIKFKGDHYYSGTVTKTFKIVKKSS